MPKDDEFDRSPRSKAHRQAAWLGLAGVVALVLVVCAGHTDRARAQTAPDPPPPFILRVLPDGFCLDPAHAEPSPGPWVEVDVVGRQTIFVPPRLGERVQIYPLDGVLAFDARR